METLPTKKIKVYRYGLVTTSSDLSLLAFLIAATIVRQTGTTKVHGMHMTEFLLLLTALLLTAAAIVARYWWRQRYPTLSISLQQVLYASDTAGWLTTSDLKIVDSNPAAKQLEISSARLPLYFGHASTEFADDELRQMIDSDEWQGQLWLGDSSRLACKARIVPLPYQHWLIWLEPNAHQLAQQQRQYDALFSPNSRLPNSQVFEFGLRHFVVPVSTPLSQFRLGVY